MKRFLSIVALLGVLALGVNLFAQQTPSTPPASSAGQAPSSAGQQPSAPAGQASSAPQQQPTDATSGQQSARSFEGKITKSGDQLVLQDSATQAAYKLDDQDKAKQFEGKNVKVMATMDASSNTLHVVDITPAESR